MKHKHIFIFLLVIFSLNVSAQRWNQRKYEFYYGLGIANFMGDIAAPTDANKYIWMNIPNTISVNANAGLRYTFKERHYVRASLYLGQMQAKDVLDNPKFHYRGYEMNSFFTELSGKYEFIIVKEKKRRTVYRQLGESVLKNLSLPTYIFVGLGANFNIGKLKQPQGLTVTTENFINIAPVVPIGIGSKLRINRTTYFGVEAGIRLAFSDGIDGAKGSESDQFGEWYDQYQFLTFNIIHKLRSNKKGLPKFKKR